MKITRCWMFLSVILACCTNPLKDVEVQISTNIIHFSALLEVQDGNGNPLSDINVVVSGQDAEKIYTLGGTRNFNVQGGILTLGLHPDSDPEPGMELRFSIRLDKAGYLSQLISVYMMEGQEQQIIPVNMLPLASAPGGVAVATPGIPLQGGLLPAEVTISSGAQNGVAEETMVTLPGNTTFKDNAGVTIVGELLEATIIHVKPSNPAALNYFPGGSLISDNVIQAPNTAPVAGVFNPAALANVEMRIGSQEVKTFSQPVTIAMQLDPLFYNMTTGALVKAGDQLSIYSYETATGIWRFESMGTVVNISGQLTVVFQTDHLSWFQVCNFIGSCPNTQSFLLNGGWMTAGIKYSLTIEAMMANKVILTKKTDITTKDNIIKINRLPLTGTTIRIRNETGEILATHSLAGSCTPLTTITLNRPSVVNRKVTMQLYVRCPNKTAAVGVLPTFYLYYREARPTIDVSGYKLLGVVEKGYISTTMLTSGTVAYDFKAVWGDIVKYSHNKVVAADNSATVGEGEGEVIGVIDPQNNLEMLKEKCKEYGL